MANTQVLKFKDITQRFIPYSFRSRIEESQSGVKVLQMKDVSVDGINWNHIVTTELNAKKAPECLARGDVLILSRGLNQLTVAVDTLPENSDVICSSMFYHYRVCSPKVNPFYLAFLLKHNQGIRHIIEKSAASGSLTTKSFPRETIENLLIPIPPMAEQNTIVALQANMQQQKRCYQALIDSNQAMLTGIANKLTK